MSSERDTGHTTAGSAGRNKGLSTGISSSSTQRKRGKQCALIPEVSSETYVTTEETPEANSFYTAGAPLSSTPLPNSKSCATSDEVSDTDADASSAADPIHSSTPETPPKHITGEGTPQDEKRQLAR